VKARYSFALPLLALLAIAGCGGSGGSSSTGPANASATGPAPSGGGGSATVDVVDNPQLGKILVDSKGMTLYTFQKDVGTKSMCPGACAKIWPPLISGHPTAGSGVSAGMLGTTKRSDGTTEVTYAGHPLYTYVTDTSPGQVTGNGVNTFGAIWNAVQPSGAKAPLGGSTPSSGGSSSGGYGSSSGGSTSSSGGAYNY
jgi:predicted lipoprotein with Yx(FWY)xxD motif